MYQCDIVIIDTGIELEHDIFKKFPNHNILTFGVRKENVLYMVPQCKDEIGHGTAVCGIILSKSPEAQVCVIKIFDTNFCVDPEYLLFALRFIEDNITCKLINMSLGISTYFPELEAICCRLTKKGCIIVSAFDNDGVVSYPAAFECVVGVEASYKCRKLDQIMLMPDSMVDILAYGYNYRIAWINNSYISMRGNSFSAAYVTASLFHLILQHKKIVGHHENIKIYLEQLATETYQNLTDLIRDDLPEDHIFQIETAAIFPYNKEMHSIVNFSDMLPFTIRHVYDIRQHGKINSVIKGRQSKREYVIENIENIVWNDIDTLIIGHLDQVAAVGMDNIKTSLLEKCLKNNINVYSFDMYYLPDFVARFRRKGLRLVCPNARQLITKNKLGKLFSVSTPVLGVFGTSSNQGKFTLQLQLRKYFLDDSYAVGQLGTEPSSLLFGMDDVFAYGYASHIRLDQVSMIETINERLHAIDKKGNDIIIIGGQAGTIPVFSFNLQYFNLYTLNLLLGSNPDAIILCVNISDPMEYISRCIHAISSLMDCTIIALAISPLTFQNDWQKMNGMKVIATCDELDRFKERLKDSFGLDSYVIGTDEVGQLYNKCLSFFG